MNTEPKLEILKGKAYLLIKNTKTFRFDKKLIGELRKNGDKINLFKVEKEKDRFHKTNSWGINYELFQMITGTINIKSEIGIYRITKEEADLWKRFLHFKNQNLEVQCFVPIEKFTFTPNV